MKNFQPLIIVGASGAGKGTVTSYLLKKFPSLFKLSVSWTTRPPRNGEINGREYFFMTHEKFNEEIANDGFIEYCHVFSNIYGTHKSQISEIISQNMICILDIDIQGAKKVYKLYPQANYLFLSVKDKQTLENRLRSRNTDSEQQIQERLSKSIDEINSIKETQIFKEIVNEDLNQTFFNVLEYLKEKYQQINFDELQQ